MDGVGLALFEVFALDWTVFWLCGFSSMQPIWVECWCLVGGGGHGGYHLDIVQVGIGLGL